MLGFPLRRWRFGAAWLAAAALGLLAGCLLAQLGLAQSTTRGASADPPDGQALRQRHVTAAAGQLAPNVYGIYLIDLDNSTMSLYEWEHSQRKLTLLAVRNFAADGQLDEYNTAPSPREIRKIVDSAKRATSQPVWP